MTEAELKAASESEDKTLAKMVARKIQPKLEEMQHANPFKKAFLIFKYVVLGNRNAKCTIPREVLESFARTIFRILLLSSKLKKATANTKNVSKRKSQKKKLVKMSCRISTQRSV